MKKDNTKDKKDKKEKRKTKAKEECKNYVVELLMALKEMLKLACFVPDRMLACKVYEH